MGSPTRASSRALYFLSTLLPASLTPLQALSRSTPFDAVVRLVNLVIFVLRTNADLVLSDFASFWRCSAMVSNCYLIQFVDEIFAVAGRYGELQDVELLPDGGFERGADVVLGDSAEETNSIRVYLKKTLRLLMIMRKKIRNLKEMSMNYLKMVLINKFTSSGL